MFLGSAVEKEQRLRAELQEALQVQTHATKEKAALKKAIDFYTSRV